MSKQSKAWAAGLVCLVLVQTAASFFSRRSFTLVALSDVLQLLLLSSAALSCLPSILRNRGRTKLFWLLMGFGFTCWLGYQFIWTYVEAVQRREVPRVFSWDALLFLHIVPMMAALALRPNAQQHDRNLRLGSLDFALLLLWWIYVYVYTVMAWQFAFTNEAAYQRNFNTSYLIEKLALLAGLILLWSRSSGPWRTIYANWFGASLLYSTSSYVANWAIARGTYYSGSFYDLPLVLSMAWMTLPGLLALEIPGEETNFANSPLRSLWASRFGMIAVSSLPVFAWLSAFDNSLPARVRTFRLVLTLGAMIVMGAMVFMKQQFLDVELIRLLRASQHSFQELQLLQSQLVQSEKLASLGQLVGGAAHELNNPLTAMLGYSELLAATELTPQQRGLADRISQQTKRVRTLVSSLLSFAKQVPATKSPVDVNTILQTSVKLCQPQMQVARVRVSEEMSQTLPQVQGDSNQLLQVFSHIINNAIEAMSERGGTITLSTWADEQTVIIQFADTGPGVREPGRVFDPFYTTRPIGQGTGLGLSACYGIIEEHGGKITCRNGDIGGAIFEIDLPALTSGTRAHYAAAQ